MRTEIRPSGSGGLLLPAGDPNRSSGAVLEKPTYIAYSGEGTGRDPGVPLTSRLGVWLARWRGWRDEFNLRIAPNCRRYWALYRNFDTSVNPGPNQEWRDRTVIPECYKILMTRLPKVVLPAWGQPENYHVTGRGFRDVKYEGLWEELLQEMLDEIGTGQADNELFLKRVIDGETYCQTMGHVWWKVSWKTEREWLRTQVPIYDADGGIASWQKVEKLETIYNNVDIRWLGLDSVACDLSGANRWKVERVQTSLQALIRENRKYMAANSGQPLYKNLDLLRHNLSTNPHTQEGYEEPRDTEHWPLSEGTLRGDPGETPVEMWLCWDNLERTITKIANRSVELAHGLSDTPYGRDPILGVPAVPVPNRVYGDSIFNWVGPLAAYQTRIARARADEVLLNLWSQYIHREGILRNTQLFWRPGGFLGVESPDTSKPISNDIQMLPRRPVFAEAYREEGYRQQQAESTAGADSVSQGVEATQKSRDVTAAEINQRVLHGATRGQMEQLYHEVAFKKPMLQMVVDQARMNMTEDKMVRVLDDQEMEDEEQFQAVNLMSLQRPVDITVGGPLFEATQAERLNEIRELRETAKTPAFMPYINVRNVLTDMTKSMRITGKRSRRYVYTEEQVKKKREEEMAMAAAAAASAAGPGAAPSGEGASTAPPMRGGVGPEAGAQPGSQGLEGPGGASASGPSSRSDKMEETV